VTKIITVLGTQRTYAEYYPADLLAERYRLVTSIGWYDLYAISR
jgi:hypothetical protein